MLHIWRCRQAAGHEGDATGPARNGAGGLAAGGVGEEVESNAKLTQTIQGFNKEVTSIQFMGSSDNMICSSGDKKISAKNTGGGNVRDYGGPIDFMYSVRTSANCAPYSTCSPW